MGRKGINLRESVDASFLALENWPTVDRESISEKKRALFDRRVGAMKAYALNVTLKKIRSQFQIGEDEVRRHFRRCVSTHKDGRLWGFRALIPRMRTKDYERMCEVNGLKASRSHSGKFQRLLKAHPEIREKLVGYFWGKFPKGLAQEHRAPVKGIHKLFLKWCREVGINTREYPFTAKELGRRTLASFLRETIGTEGSVRNRYGEDVARSLASQGHISNDLPAIRPYQRVLLDGHRIDKIFCVEYTDPLGMSVEAIAERPWLLVIMDAFSRAILGYLFCLKSEYSSEDVLRCVKRTIEPWKTLPLTIPGMGKSSTAGMPSERFKELEYAVWDELWYDNAKANLAERVRDKLTHQIGCAINAGPVKTPERRGILERFFQTLEKGGFHRLPSTTGSGPDDPRRRDAEKNAVRFKVKAEEIEQLLEVLISEYNGSPHSSLNHRSPLEVLDFHLDPEKGSPIRVLDAEARSRLGLLDMRLEKTIRGNLKEGRRPYIEFEGVRYQNDVLSHSFALIGKRIFVFVDADDLRTIRAYYPDGGELGVLTAKGGWVLRPHDLATRKAINQLRRRRLIHFLESEDPIPAYLAYLNKKAEDSRASRTKLERTRAITQMPPETAMTPPAELAAEPASPNIQQPPPMQRGLLNKFEMKSINY